MQDALDAAQIYLARGWVPLPVHYIREGGCSCGNLCAASGKHPVGGWSDTNRDNALDRFKDWYVRHPGTNIGIRTGVISGIVVLDIDVKPGQQGLESIAALIEKYGPLPETLEAETGSGGVHLFFRAPKDPVPSSAGSVGAGLDVRGEGGQVVAAPSKHKSGGAYFWVNWGTPLAEVPDWLLLLMNKKKSVGTTAPSDNSTAFAKQRLDHHYAMIRGASEGEGRNKLNAAAYEMGRYARYISIDQVFDKLKEAANLWDHPMEPERLEKTLHDGLRDGEAQALSKPEIIISTDIPSMINQALDAVSQEDNIFRRHGELVRILLESKDKMPKLALAEPIPVIDPISKDWLEVLLSKHVSWIKISKGKDGLIRKEELPPQFIIDGLSAQGEWEKVRHLEMITTTPIMRADGTVLEAPGYDHMTGVIYAPDYPHEAIPESPTVADVQNAVAELDDVIGEFVFESPANRAAWFASVLTPLARHMIRGSVPMFLVDSSTQGTGKTLLVRLACIIATGSEPPMYDYTPENEEIKKLITSMGMAGHRIYFFDNINADVGVLGGSGLAKALTSPHWGDRVLGQNKTWQGKLIGSWYGSGNNVIIDPDMARRIVHIRICPTQERPDEKSTFKYYPLVDHVKKNKHRLVRAALIILRGRYTAGVPETKLPAWGDYVEWTNIVRQACVMAGVGDPAGTRMRLRDLADIENDSQRAFVRGWKEIANLIGGNPRSPITVKVVLNALYPQTGQSQFPGMRDALDSLVRVRTHMQPSANQVAAVLRKIRHRIFDGMMIDLIEKKNDVAYWAVVPAVHMEQQT